MNSKTEQAGTRRLVIADPLFAEGLDLLAAAPDLVIDDRSAGPRDAVREALPGAVALIVRSRTKVDADLLAAADHLEVIGRAGVGVDNIDVEEATRRGIAVLNAPGGNTCSTAELTFALIMSAARRIPEADASVRGGRWDRKVLRGRQLLGQTLGVVGAGRIGSEVIRRARGFGMHVVAFDPYLTAERANDLGLEQLELEELLGRADIVTIHVPLTETTRSIIGEAEIEAMKDGAMLVNAARGGLVDEKALAEALSSGKLAAAALDTFETEPLPEDSPLRSAPNLVFTPHIGAATDQAQREVSREIAVAVLDALLSGDLGAALNAPYVSPSELGLATPVLDLARRLGVVLAELTQGRCERLDVRYAGPVEGVLRPLAAAALEGYLRSSVGRRVNLVSAMTLAAERGIEVGRVRIGEVADYANYVELHSVSDGETTAVGGALLGEAHHPRIVRIEEFHVDVVPAAVLLVIRNRDVPGVIGDVGMILGKAGVNIAEYHLSRQAAGGEALGIIRIDGELSEDTLDALRSLEAVDEIRQVVFPLSDAPRRECRRAGSPRWQTPVRAGRP
jgi:D-3-phosphoglycerate dehydrogenase